MRKKLFKIVVAILFAALLAGTLFACAPKRPPDDGETPGSETPAEGKVSRNEVLDKIYNGLIDGGKRLNAAGNRGVDTVYSIRTGVMNYDVVYRANYRENTTDSEIYISFFDNDSNIERIAVYYGGRDLFVKFGEEDKFLVPAFNESMIFGVFYDFCLKLDLTKTFFGKSIGRIFNRDSDDSGTAELGAFDKITENLRMPFQAKVNNENTTYTRVSETREALELVGMDLSIITREVNNMMERSVGGIEDKFDIVTERFLGFRLSRLLEGRFTEIKVKTMGFYTENGVADSVDWVYTGRLADTDKYTFGAKIGYNDGATPLAERNNFRPSDFKKAVLGVNEFLGSVLIPAIDPDHPYRAEFKTNVNTRDNSKNEGLFRVTDDSKTEFLSTYYRGENVYVDATGVYRWLNGPLDLDVLNLPKVHIDDVDLSRILKAFYGNLASILGTMTDSAGPFRPAGADKELFDCVMRQFSSDDETIYFTLTEDLVKRIRGSDESLMLICADMLGTDEDKLASYLGKDFFSASEFVLSYNLFSHRPADASPEEIKDEGVIGLKMIKKGKLVFDLEMQRESFGGISFPPDANPESGVYSALKEPDTVTLEIEADLRADRGINFPKGYFIDDRGTPATGTAPDPETEYFVSRRDGYVSVGKLTDTGADFSKVLGAFLGDPSGNNSVLMLKNADILTVKCKINESSYKNPEGESIGRNNIQASVLLNGRKAVTLRSDVRSPDKFLIGYYLPVGNRTDNSDGIHYFLDRQAVKDSFGKVLGEDNIFTENNVLNVLEIIMSSKGMRLNGASEGYFGFSLAATGEGDPLNRILGVSNAKANVRARVRFRGLGEIIDGAKYWLPEITPLDSVVFETVYDKDSAWKKTVPVRIGDSVFDMNLTYDEESVKIEAGKSLYFPVAHLFGEKVEYSLTLGDKGAYAVEALNSNVVVVDPAYGKTLPTKVSVRFENGAAGELPCRIIDFDEANITCAGFNLAGFAEPQKLGTPDLPEVEKSVLVIGENSIMEKRYEVYVLVHNRVVAQPPGIQWAAVGAPPIVGEIVIDPYTYLMKKSDDKDYDPVSEGIETQNMQLRFGGAYTDADGNDRSYEIRNYNVFDLTDLNLNWDWDVEKNMTFRGGISYALASFGDIKIAIRIKVAVREVDYVKIDDYDPGQYTIDFLDKSSYAVPKHCGVNNAGAAHIVEVYFKHRDSTAAQGHRKIADGRPADISDEDWHNNYLLTSVEWNIPKEVYEKVKKSGTRSLFGANNRTTGKLEFGTDGTAESSAKWEQTIDLEILVPSRDVLRKDRSEKNYPLIYKCEAAGETGSGELNFSRNFFLLDSVKFTKNHEYYDAFEINPYDKSAVLPNEVYLRVKTGVGNKTEDKKYRVLWLTTDSKGEDSGLFVKRDNGFGLRHPVTNEQEMIIYGKIGPDCDSDDGHIVIQARVKNLASEVASGTYYDRDGNDVEMPESGEIEINPFKPYSFPCGFSAILQSGKTLSETGLKWFAKEYREDGEDVWFPIDDDGSGSGPDYCKHYYDNKLVFEPGKRYILRHIIENREETMRQEFRFTVAALNPSFNGKDYIDNIDPGFEAESFKGVKNKFDGIDCYAEYSFDMAERLKEIRNSPDELFSVRFGNGKGGDCEYRVKISWTDTGISPLIDAFKTPDSAGSSVNLSGTIYTGSLNERVISVPFNFKDNVAKDVFLTNAVRGMSDESVTILHTTEQGIDLDALDLDDETGKKTIEIRFEKPYGLTRWESERQTYVYASPYEYVKYIFEKARVGYENGSDAELTPEIVFTEMTEKQFNDSVLGRASNSVDPTVTEITLRRLSKGSAINDIKVKIEAPRDRRLDEESALVAELYRRDGGTDVLNVSEIVDGDDRDAGIDGLCRANSPDGKLPLYYKLPSTVEVRYEISGTVAYDVDGWIVSESCRGSYENVLGASGGDKLIARGIPAELINVLSAEGSEYLFLYKIPCEGPDDEYYSLRVTIPKMKIGDNWHYTYGRDGGFSEGGSYDYEVEKGVWNIGNPYLIYDGTKPYNLDASKIPDIICPDKTEDYAVEGKTHKVKWYFKDDVFTADKFYDGISDDSPAVLAEATLPAGYGPVTDSETGETTIGKIFQTVRLKIKFPPMEFYGIEKEFLTVKQNDESDKRNVIVVNPHRNDKFGGAASRFEPPSSLTVLFGEGKTAPRFSSDGLKYIIYDKDGNPVEKKNDEFFDRKGYLNAIPYTTSGHALGTEYPDIDWREDGKLALKLCGVPGYDSEPGNTLAASIDSNAIILWVVIQNKDIADVEVFNQKFESDGNYAPNGVELPGLYYIDPYNTSTFALPRKVSVKFKFAGNEYEEVTVYEWGLKNEDGVYEPLPTKIAPERRFYSRQCDSAAHIKYGFYNPGRDGYKGGVYTLKGYIALGNSSFGNDDRPGFDMTVVVLNRSLRTPYEDRYTFDNPLIGLLEDIPHELHEDMFVNFEDYYSVSDENNRYGSKLGSPFLPGINWGLDDSVIDIRGDFVDKAVEGGVFAENSNKGNLYRRISEELTAEYEKYIKALVWDAMFDENGAPLYNYKNTPQISTRDTLIELAKKLEKDVVSRTYVATLEELNSSASPDDNALGRYLSRTLYAGAEKESAAEGKSTQEADVTFYMFGNLQEKYAGSAASGSADPAEAIYARWTENYRDFKARPDLKDATKMSEYRIMQSKIYVDAAKELHLADNYPALNDETAGRLFRTERIRLNIYKNALIWDALYDESTASERERMEFFIGAGGTERAKDLALFRYMRDSSAATGSKGEPVSVKISAPKLSLGEVYSHTDAAPVPAENVEYFRYDDGVYVSCGVLAEMTDVPADFPIGYYTEENGIYTPVVSPLNEFRLNIYDKIAYIAKVDVGTILNYSSIFDKYIAEAERLAREDYTYTDTAEAIKEDILKNYEERKKREYISSLAPTKENGDPVTEFDYDVYAGLSDEEKQSAVYTEKWKTIYNYKKEAAVAHIGEYDGDETSDEAWENFKTMYNTIKGSSSSKPVEVKFSERMLDEMDEIENAGGSLTPGGRLSRYKDAAQKVAVEEMDKIFDRVLKNAVLRKFTDIMLPSGVLDDGLDVTTKEALFEKVYSGDVRTEAKTYLLHSYAADSDEYTFVDGKNIYSLLYGDSASNNPAAAVKKRAKIIFDWVIFGDVPAERMKENLDKFGLDRDMYEKFKDLIKAGDYSYDNMTGGGNQPKMTEDKYESFVEYYLCRLFEFQTPESSPLAALFTEWNGEAGRISEKNKDLFDYFAEKKIPDSGLCKAKAFEAYVKFFEKEAENETKVITDKRDGKRKYKLFTESESIRVKINGLLTEPIPAVGDPGEYKAAALGYVYDRYAAEDEKVSIDYLRTLYPDNDIFDILERRGDIPQRLKDELTAGCRYMAIEDWADAKIEDFSDGTLPGADDSKLSGYKEKFGEVYEGTHAEASDIYLSILRQAYINGKIAELRTEAEGSILTAAAKNAIEREIYDAVTANKEVDAVLWSAVFDDYYEAHNDESEEGYIDYSMRQNVYNDIAKVMAEEELAAFREGVEKICGREAKTEVYDEFLEPFKPYTVDDLPGDVYAKFKDLYDSVTARYPDKKGGFDGVIGNLYGAEPEEEEFLDRLNSIRESYYAAKNTEATGLDDILGAYTGGIEGIARNFIDGGGETAGTVELSVGENYHYRNLTDKNHTVDATFAIMALRFELNKAMKDAAVSDEGERKEIFVDKLLTLLNSYKPSKRLLLSEIKSKYEPWEPQNSPDPREERVKTYLMTTEINKDIAACASLFDYVEGVKNAAKRRVDGVGSPPQPEGDARHRDAAFLDASGRLASDIRIKQIFYTDGNARGDELRTVVKFGLAAPDPSGGGSAVIQGSGSLYLTNEYKFDEEKISEKNSREIPGNRFIYSQLELAGADFYPFEKITAQSGGEPENYPVGYYVFFDGDYRPADGEFDSGTSYYKIRDPQLNELQIDPLAPALPAKVMVYGRFADETGAFAAGMSEAIYEDAFSKNHYSGESSGGQGLAEYYLVTVKDAFGDSAKISVRVKYVNRKVEHIYYAGNLYGGSLADGKYDLRDGAKEKNVIKIDPVRDAFLDPVNKRYILPEKLAIEFEDDENVYVYRNIVWDTENIEYSLSGRTVSMRIISFVSEKDENGYARKIEFKYTENKVVITLFRDEIEVRSDEFSNVPGIEIWNTDLEIADRTPTKLITRDGALLGERPDGKDYIDVKPEILTVNPFYIEYPEKVKIGFSEAGPISDVSADDWSLEEGEEGVRKVVDIIEGENTDGHVMANISYSGYAVRVRIPTYDIAFEQNIEGGTLYLVRGGGSAREQIEKNYPHMYYNFSQTPAPDWRKVPLSFLSLDLNDISTSASAALTTTEVEGFLGWDSERYPSIPVPKNIKFTISVIDPRLYYNLNDAINPYVRMDRVSVPRNEEYRIMNPGAGKFDKFIQTGADGNMEFRINKDKIVYDMVKGTVNYPCKFEMNGSERLAFNENGGKDIYFTVPLPMDEYDCTAAEGETFVRESPRETGREEGNIWIWAGGFAGDAIKWKLGRSMATGDLPKLRLSDGREIRLRWDLNDVNVNKAKSAEQGGYKVFGYYYNGETEEKKELSVYIDRKDIKESVLENSGGSVDIERVYDGHYYVLPFVRESEGMRVLRENGELGFLPEKRVKIEYKPKTALEDEYRSNGYPLNKGEYDIRVKVNDYNFFCEVVFDLIVKPHPVDVTGLEFENDLPDSPNPSFIYDGKPHGMVITGGLPEISPDNWFTVDEKRALWSKYESKGEIEAKRLAYKDLYNRVTPRTKDFLTREKKEFAESNNMEADSAEVIARYFDTLRPEKKIREIIIDVEYRSGGQKIPGVPVNVGEYGGTMRLADENNGNYQFIGAAGDVSDISKSVTILKNEIEYSFKETAWIYDGKSRYPKITGLNYDENGNLTGGAKVKYTVKKGNEIQPGYGVVAAGTYRCEAKIEGGQNYPDGEISETEIEIRRRDLYVTTEDIINEYLSPVPDVGKHLLFNGGKNRSEFAGVLKYVVARIIDENDAAAGDYSPVGNYIVVFEGLKSSANSESFYAVPDRDRPPVLPDFPSGYYTLDNGVYVSVPEGSEPAETEYYKIAPAAGPYDGFPAGYCVFGDEGYTPVPPGTVEPSPGTAYFKAIRAKKYYKMNLTAEGRQSGDIYAAFGNYNVYVADGNYTIKTGEGFEIIETAESFAGRIEALRDGDKRNFYLKPIYNEDGTLGSYPAVTINAAADVTLKGCYDSGKNIRTFIDGITVKKGSLTLEIVGFKAKNPGDVLLFIGDEAGLGDVGVQVKDCLFDGLGKELAVGIRVSERYRNGLYIEGDPERGTRFGNLECALEFNNGTKLEIGGARFVGNASGVIVNRLENSDDNVRIYDSSFEDHSEAAIRLRSLCSVRDNVFSRNKIALALDFILSDDDDLRNFNEYRNNLNDIKYALSD